MDINQKKKILCRLPYIAEKTSNIPPLLNHLISTGVLSLREKANINSHPSDYDRAVDLCTTLLSKRGDAFTDYVKALQETGNSHVKDKIETELTEEESRRSIDECYYNLDNVIKGSKAERKLQFYQTLGKVETLVFQSIGVPGNLGVYSVLWNYYVLDQNSDGERLFNLTWHRDKVYCGFKAINVGCRPCYDVPTAYTKPLRLCTNLFGETIMEIDTPTSTSDIMVGNDFLGSVTGNYIRNAENLPVWYAERACLSKIWNVYEFFTGEKGQLCAQFGFNSLPTTEHGLMFKTAMNNESKARLLGAAMIYMDEYNQQHIFLQFLKLSKYHFCAFFAVVVIIVLIIPLLISFIAPRNPYP